jgi:hypothetical protein
MLFRLRQFLALITYWRIRRTFYYLSSSQYRVIADRVKHLILHSQSEQRKQFPLTPDVVASFDEYKCHRHHMIDEYAKRVSIERSLVRHHKSSFDTEGFCYACGQPSLFLSDFQYGAVEHEGAMQPNWRERMVCHRCKMNNRVRAAVQLFEEIGAPTSNSRIYVTEQVTSLYKWLHQHYPLTIGSEYLASAVPWGKQDSRGVRNENVTCLTFPDNSLDYILSFDVFEHVPDYAEAFRECLRCLKPGGMLLFTVPFLSDSEGHLERAIVKKNGEIQHLLPAEYHGDPLSTEGCLCFRHFGWSLLDELRAIGFIRVAANLYWSDQLAYLGGEQLAFVGFKE